MLINSVDLLKKARATGRCIPAFNVYNLETVQAAFTAAKAVKAPLMLALGESYIDDAPLSVIAAMVKVLDKEHEFPVVLHLDHAKKIDTIEAAIDAGFTSVMYDGSHLKLEENIKNTCAVINLAQSSGVSVEGEIGSMNPEDGSEDWEIGETNPLTDPAQAKLYVSETQVDSLAVVIGNAHGMYKGVPSLDFERLDAICEQIDIPIVLHGCSGIPQQQILKAISKGVAKINVNTEIALTGSHSIKTMFQGAGYDDIRLEKLMSQARKGMAKAMEGYLRMTYAR